MACDSDLDAVLEEIASIARPAAEDGKVASHLPSIARLDPEHFGLAVVEMDGTEHVTGDVDVPFPLQSISKVFALALALQRTDSEEGVRKELWQRVGVEPSGDPFNSLVQLEHEHGVPRNPMINSGALVVDDLLRTHCDDPSGALFDLIGELAGECIGSDETVLRAEKGGGHLNRAMAHLMSSFGNLTNGIDEVLDVYVRQCAAAMTTRQLARSVRFLANGGVDPASGRRILDSGLARRVGALMLTCGTYDAAGEFAFDVGFPCKSGVAGGIVGLATSALGVCVWSPPLGRTGNSLAGRVALHELSERLDLSLFRA